MAEQIRYFQRYPNCSFSTKVTAEDENWHNLSLIKIEKWNYFPHYYHYLWVSLKFHFDKVEEKGFFSQNARQKSWIYIILDVKAYFAWKGNEFFAAN